MSISFDYGKEYGTPAFPVMNLKIIGKSDRVEAKGLVDSGADATMIPLDILEQIEARQLDVGWIRTISSQK